VTKTFLGCVVAPLRDPLGYRHKQDRTLVRSTGGAWIGEEVPIPVLDLIRCDGPIAVDLPTYGHVVPFDNRCFAVLSYSEHLMVSRGLAENMGNSLTQIEALDHRRAVL
jgi:hypothetical protein